MMSFSQIFFHSANWDEAISILKQLTGFTPSGALDWSDIPAYLLAPTALCAAIALYVGAGTPGAGWLGSRVNPFVPRWAVYGLCLFLLPTLTTESAGKFIYGQF
jgi:hypothetical protein